MYLDNGIVFPSHPIDPSIYYMDYISLVQFTHTLYIRYTELEQYSFNELRDMIKPGVIKGQIIV